MAKESGNVQEKINHEVYMGVVPSFKEDRIYNATDITLTAAGFGVASWCYTQGAWIASELPFPLSIFVTFVPLLFFGLIFMYMSTISTRNGIDHWIYQRAVFGYKFCSIICIISILTNWGWYAINCNVFSNSVTCLFSLAGINLSSSYAPWIGSLCAIIGFLIALKGPYAVKLSTYIMVPCLLAVGVLIVIKVLTTFSISDLAAMEPIGGSYGSTKMGYLVMIEGMFAFLFSWYPVIGTPSRLCKSERSSYWGQTAGYMIALGVFVGIGILTATIMGSKGIYSTDPTDYLMTLDNKIWSVLSILAIAIANITTEVLGCYCLSMATKVFKPNLSYKKVCLGYTIFVIALLFWHGVLDYYSIFLAVTSIVAAPSVMIVLIDYFVLRKERFSFKAIYKRENMHVYKYTGGFNIIAVIAFVCGVIAYLVTYDPVNCLIRNKFLMHLTPTGITCIVTSVVYLGLSKIPACRKYLLRDAELEECKNMEKYSDVSDSIYDTDEELDCV